MASFGKLLHCDAWRCLDGRRSRQRAVRLQGSRAGTGELWAGRAKSFWEKGICVQMLESPAIWLGCAATNARPTERLASRHSINQAM